MATNNEKLKTVENYVLEAQRYVNSDQSEIWVARHKILKKNYMLKRIQYVKNPSQKIANFETNDEINAFKLKKVSYQIEILKHLKLSGSPKCQKMIKTSNCIYIVYDQFPGASLHQLAMNEQLSHKQKLKTIINLSKTLLNYHHFSILFLLLSPDNVFLSENQNIFFGEWSSVVYKNNTSHTFPILSSRKSQFIAHQVLQESRCSPASDIFSLGKIFQYLADKNQRLKKTQSDMIELKALSEHMTQYDDKKRPSLQQVIEKLENMLKSLPQIINLTHSKGLYKIKLQSRLNEVSFGRYESQIAHNKQIQMKNTASSTNLREKSPLEGKQTRNSRLSSKYSFDSILIGMSRATNRPSLSRSTRSNQLLVKKVAKYRNLGFFLIGLSEFAMKWSQGDVLGYLLMKQAYLILNVCYNEWNNQGFQDKSSKALTNILKAEILQLNLSLNMLKEYLLPQKCDQQFKAQLRNDLLINDKFYKEQILAFCKRLMDEFDTAKKENKIKNLKEFVDNLFSVYMILKRQEQGSFEKYWDKIYRSQFAFLKSQNYFQEEKKLGYKYLRSKISQILSKK